jgi:hypothetical protein
MLALVLALAAESAVAEERWEEYWACEQNVLVNVEQVEPSIWDGADLIVRALCIMAAGDLANDMVSQRGMATSQPYGSAFESALSAIRRETAIKLYNARRLRLGLERN